MSQYVVRIDGTGDLFGPFSSGESALEWAYTRLTVEYTLLPLRYPI